STFFRTTSRKREKSLRSYCGNSPSTQWLSRRSKCYSEAITPDVGISSTFSRNAHLPAVLRLVRRSRPCSRGLRTAQEAKRGIAILRTRAGRDACRARTNGPGQGVHG